MSIDLRVEEKQLRKALQLYERATDKDEVEILNKAARNTLLDPGYGLYRNAPKADKSKIEAKVWGGDPPLAFILAAKKLGGKSLGASDYTKSGRVRAGSRWQRRVAKEARSIAGRRKSAIGYHRAGWIEAGLKAGFSKRALAKGFAGRGRKGTGYQARVGRLVAELVNLTTKNSASYQRRGLPALRLAVAGAAVDMGTYARKKMAQTARKHSAKGARR